MDGAPGEGEGTIVGLWAPRGCQGQDQTSRGSLERLVGPDPGPLRREPATGGGVKGGR